MGDVPCSTKSRQSNAGISTQKKDYFTSSYKISFHNLMKTRWEDVDLE